MLGEVVGLGVGVKVTPGFLEGVPGYFKSVLLKDSPTEKDVGERFVFLFSVYLEVFIDVLDFCCLTEDPGERMS